MTFQNSSAALSNGAEVIGDFIRSVGKSVAKKVSRRHSMAHYDRLRDPVIPRSCQTMSNLAPVAEQPSAQNIRTPSVTSVRPTTNPGGLVEFTWAVKRRRGGSMRSNVPVLPVFLKTYNAPIGVAR